MKARHLIKSLLLLGFLLGFSSPTIATTYPTIQDAYTACQTAGGYCIPVNQVPGCPATTAQYSDYKAFLRSSSPPTSCSGLGFFSWENGCTAPMVWNTNTASCSCPAGTHDNGLGQCIQNPPDCTLSDINTMADGCPIESSYTGWEQHTCWDESQQAVGVVPACDPTCGQGQHLENHQCVANPQCVGDQTYNFSTNTCDEPQCSVGQILDTAAHTCNDIQCTQTQILCGSECLDRASSCEVGFDSACGSLGGVSCQFNQCPSGYTQISLAGVPFCQKTGDTTSGTGTATQTGTGTSTTTTQHPDGTTTSSTTTTTNNSTSEINIDLDTAGLAQESTQKSILEQLKDLTKQLTGTGTPNEDYAGQVCSGGQCGAHKTEVNLNGVDMYRHNGVVQPSGSCPSPRVVNVFMGVTMTIDYSVLCEWATYISFMLLITASILATRIIVQPAM